MAPAPTTTVSVVEPEAGLSGAPRQWREDMARMRRVCDYKVHREALSAVAMSADNFWIFSASHDSVLKVRKCIPRSRIAFLVQTQKQNALTSA